MDPRPLEITDLLWSTAADGTPRPVLKADVLDQLRARGQRRAVRIVSALPAADGILDAKYIDALGVRVHCELQRLGEELQLARRVAALLAPIVAGIRRRDAGPVRVVDVGCGLGFVVRALAASAALGTDVELVGVDLNPVLVAKARQLARQEGLVCRFEQGDAFAPGVAIADGSPRPGRAAPDRRDPPMTAAVAATLLTLALLDGAFAGFRSAAGRTGLINHHQYDQQAVRRGARLAGVLLAPVIAVVCGDAFAHPARLADYTRAGAAMLAIYGPYALLVLIALIAYATLKWELKYLASALILGPLTLLRPTIAVLGAILAGVSSHDLAVTIAAALSVIAVLAVEPLAGRLWYARPARDTAAPDSRLERTP